MSSLPTFKQNDRSLQIKYTTGRVKITIVPPSSALVIMSLKDQEKSSYFAGM